jgi:hypothetical protein
MHHHPQSHRSEQMSLRRMLSLQPHAHLFVNNVSLSRDVCRFTHSLTSCLTIHMPQESPHPRFTHSLTSCLTIHMPQESPTHAPSSLHSSVFLLNTLTSHHTLLAAVRAHGWPRPHATATRRLRRGTKSRSSLNCATNFGANPKTRAS